MAWHGIARHSTAMRGAARHDMAPANTHLHAILLRRAMEVEESHEVERWHSEQYTLVDLVAGQDVCVHFGVCKNNVGRLDVHTHV